MKIITKFNNQALKIINIFCNVHDFQYNYCISDNPLDVINVSDMYLNLSDIIYALENRVTTNQFLDWYWNYWFESIENKLNLKNYLKLKI